MAAGASTTDSWVWDPTHQLYYSPFSQAYAYTDPTTGQWVYLPTSSLGTDPSAHAESSAAAAARAGNAKSEREEGEIEDDVGWGGLMEPEELEKVMQSQAASQAKAAEKLHQNGTTTSRELEKHPAYGGGGSNTTYDDPSLYAYDRSRLRSPSPPLSSAKDKDKEVPNHILRLVVISSPTLAEGSVAVLDAREGGVQLGRDRCEKGAQPRLRIKEMEVSKTHGVVYWGTEGGKKEEWELIASDEEEDKGEEGWWIVDLGSTHGTFVTHVPEGANGISSAQDIIDLTNDTSHSNSASNTAKPHRLSSSKTSSLPYELHHLSRLTLGLTTLEAHIHPSWPCDACQLGKGNEIALDTGEVAATSGTASGAGTVVLDNNWDMAMDNKQRRDNREINRKREMAALRETLINRRSAPAPAAATVAASSSSSSGMQNGGGVEKKENEEKRYIDRSAMRRQLHPSSPPRHPNTTNYPERSLIERNQQTPSRTETPPPAPGPSAFAQNLLAAQGWTPGSGLGKDLSGRSVPIDPQMRVEKRGLGAQGSLAVRDEGADGDGDWRKRAKMRRYEEVRGR